MHKNIGKKLNEPKVSVVIPVYNRPFLLKRALESLLAQNYKNWEAVIVDDGSTDVTALVAGDFAQADKRFRVILNRHFGGAKATNDGILFSNGEYITLLGSDDAYEPGHLAIRVKRMRAIDTPDLLHGGFRVIGSPMVPDKRDIAKLISLYDPNVYVGGTFFGKREVFIDLRGFKKMPYASDSDFLERAMLKYKIVRINEPTYIYHRDHQKSATGKILQSVKHIQETVAAD